MPQIVFSGGNSSAGSFNMGMWNPSFIISLLSDDNTSASGNATQATFTNALTFGGPTTLVAQGSFSNYTADGPQSGTVTSFSYTTYFTPGVPVTMQVSGLSISVATLNTWVITGNVSALETALFGGNDTFTGTNFNDSILGYLGNDTINAGAGNDSAYGDNGDDTINGGDGDDYLGGGNNNDTINGGDGNDDLSGGDGADTVFGGAGDDTFDALEAGDVFDGGDGTDRFGLGYSGGSLTINADSIRTSTGVTFANGGTVRNMERFSVGIDANNATLTVRGTLVGQNDVGLFGTGDLLVLDFTGAAETYQVFQVASDRYNFIGANGSLSAVGVESMQIVGIGGDTFYGTFGTQIFTGTVGADTFFASYGNDTVNGGDGNDTIWGEFDNDTLNGGNGADTIYGGEGVDALNGGAGDDFLSGDDGVDTFNGGDGVDTVNYALVGAGIVVDLATPSSNTGAAAGESYTSIESIIGTDHNDTLRGNASANVLQGGWGDDLLEGRDGADALYGGYGVDVLIGGADADLMDGGGGDDVYFVDNAGDTIVEINGAGSDTVYSVINYTLADHADTLSVAPGFTGAINFTGNLIANMLVGNAAVNGLDGGGGADTLIGGGGNDLYFIDDIADVVIENVGEGSADVVYTSLAFYQLGDNVEQLSVTASTGTFASGNSINNLIVGNAGADALDGGAGVDTLVGGEGNDSYFVDNIADVIIELAGGGAAEVVYTSLAFYQLGDNVEQLSVTGTTGTYAVGNSVANLIVGNSGADALDGGAGADTLVGGAGNDSYLVDNVADVIIEVAGEGAEDVVYTSLAFYQLGDNVEQLSVTAATGTFAVGNSVNNLIVGNAGADALEGRGGMDVLVGGGGADTFIFNNAAEGADVITDFTVGVDHISISATGFGGGLVNGAAAPFVAGATPSAVGASFLYDTDDGNLYWDSDGAGGAAAILVATLSGAPTLTASDIIIGP